MNKGEGKYADPTERKRGAANLVNMLKEQEAKKTNEN
jgi:hypothetical protein